MRRTTIHPGLSLYLQRGQLQFLVYTDSRFSLPGCFSFPFVFHSRARSRAPKAEDSRFFSVGRSIWAPARTPPAAHRLPDKTPAPTHPRLRSTPAQEDRNNGYIAGPATRSTSRAAIYLCQQAFPLPVPPVAPARACSPTPDLPDSDSPRSLAYPPKVRAMRGNQRRRRARTPERLVSAGAHTTSKTCTRGLGGEYAGVCSANTTCFPMKSGTHWRTKAESQRQSDQSNRQVRSMQAGRRALTYDHPPSTLSLGLASLSQQPTLQRG